jgi:hypothetical protein
VAIRFPDPTEGVGETLPSTFLRTVSQSNCVVSRKKPEGTPVGDFAGINKPLPYENKNKVIKKWLSSDIRKRSLLNLKLFLKEKLR